MELSELAGVMTPCSRWRHTAYARRKLQSVDNHNQSVDNHNFVTKRTGDCNFGRWPPAFTPPVAPGPPLLPVCAAAPFLFTLQRSFRSRNALRVGCVPAVQNLTYHRQTTAMVMTDKIDPMNIPNSNCVMLEHPLDVPAPVLQTHLKRRYSPEEKIRQRSEASASAAATRVLDETF